MARRISTERYLNKINDSVALGLHKELLMNSEVRDRGLDFRITFDVSCKALITKERCEKIRVLLQLKKPLCFGLSKNTLTDTPKMFDNTQKGKEYNELYNRVRNDPGVVKIIDTFNASLISVHPCQSA
jgi:hypothetical protein